MTPRILPRPFYQRNADIVASELLGKIIVHRTPTRLLRARIVETEAYVGTHDLASHASRGRTRRTEVMFGEAGHAYVYFIYGMHEMFNVVTSRPDDPQAVLIRAAEPLDGFPAPPNLSGPGRFAKGMAITRDDNARDLTLNTLFITDPGPLNAPILRAPRIGVDYAKHWAAQPLRFAIAHHPAVSKPWPWKK